VTNRKQKILQLFNHLKQKLGQVYYVILFFILLLSFHYIYKWWAGPIGYFPLATQVSELFNWASLLLLNQSAWVLENLFHINFHITLPDQAIHVQSSNGIWTYLLVSPGCTSLKQWMHWLFLMLLFPGTWKHKLWYIPLGLIIIEFVNVVRIVGLTLTMIPWPTRFHFFHDYFFKTFFYIMIFLLWVIWVHFFLKPSSIRSAATPTTNNNQ